MTEPVSVPFELNQQQLDAAILASLPRLAAQLSVDYTNGRAPNGLRAAVNLTEEQIREAVIEHVKRMLNSQFRFFSVSFRATRGDDGLTTSIVASTHPIAPEAPATSAAALNTTAAAPTQEPEPTPAPTAEEAPTNTAAAEEAPAESPAPASEEAPWEGEAVSDAPAPSPEPTAEAPVEEAAPAPAPTGRKLFGDLQRPQND